VRRRRRANSNGSSAGFGFRAGGCGAFQSMAFGSMDDILNRRRDSKGHAAKRRNGGANSRAFRLAHTRWSALYFMGYNFARVHQTLRVTPAMEAGLAGRYVVLSRKSSTC
jgi:hypothetical protein